jgi:hypothetical protein
MVERGGTAFFEHPLRPEQNLSPVETHARPDGFTAFHAGSRNLTQSYTRRDVKMERRSGHGQSIEVPDHFALCGASLSEIRTPYLELNAKQLAIGLTCCCRNHGQLPANMEMYHEEAYRCSRADDRDCHSELRSDRERSACVPGEPHVRKQRLLIADKLRLAHHEVLIGAWA